MAELTQKRTVLVAIDEGEESMYALSWCLKNIVSRNSEDALVLLHAKPLCPVYPIIDNTGSFSRHLFSPELMEINGKYMSDLAQRLMGKAKEMCKDMDVAVKTRIESGDPRDVICQTAQELGADVLVMGTHGYGSIKRAFLGSVSNHCAQHVSCPVLIVKRPKSTTGDA